MSKRRGYICCGVPMIAESTRKPSAFLIVRYRKCLCCGTRITTEERISQTRKSTRPSTGTPPEPTEN